MEETNRIENWHKTEKTICRLNKELSVRVNILTNEPSIKFRKSKDSNQFSIYPDYKEFVILNFSDFNDKSLYTSVCFGIEQFYGFIEFLEMNYNSWFKYTKIENGIPDYKCFKFSENENKFIVKNEFRNTRKRFENTCNHKPIDIVPETMEEDNIPRVGMIIAFDENKYTFIKKNELNTAIRLLKNTDFLSICSNLFTMSLFAINSSLNIRSQSNSEFTYDQEKAKIKLIETKRDLFKYCKNNKINFTKEEFDENSLEDLKEAVLKYITNG